MQDIEFEQYDSSKYPNHMDWERHILESLPAETALKTLFAAPVLEFLAMFEDEGMLAFEELQRDLRELPKIDLPEFDEKLYEARMHLYREIDRFQTAHGLSDDPLVVDPRLVLEHLSAHNPFFRRWLEFQKIRPRLHPEDWDSYAAAGVDDADIPYARAMRDLGQLLQDLIARRKCLTADLATKLMRSNALRGLDRYQQTTSSIICAEKDGQR